MAEQKAGPTDRAALLLMLAYVEGECRRVGAIAAAEHAAMAAATLVSVTPTPTTGLDRPLH